MTQVKCTPNGQSLKEVVGEDADFLRTMVGEVVQQVLASEMDACLQAQKGERTPGRLGYRSGYYERPFVRGHMAHLRSLHRRAQVAGPCEANEIDGVILGGRSRSAGLLRTEASQRKALSSGFSGGTDNIAQRNLNLQ